ncbi:phage tail tape measure protein [Clostridium formicaceticum]|uniref:Phage tail tape measure protein n=1 Tax=Clostridium formicaceticum TaxID=1497 RepID=A0AAC9WFS1_9CLOT|nr:phage tail tape measure protein [Clostridium formicaceticum]AOY76686.1 phage tail tape measure protein [Clostridium formicaceticum]ARE87118.1 Phage-related minor tail protein [Clostridium formicaceticum]
MSRTIATILALKDKISSPLVKVSKNVDKVTREMKKSQNQVERWKNKSVKAMDNVIKKTAKVALAAGALAGAFAVKVGFDGLLELEEGAAKVKSIAKNSLDLKDIQKDLLKYSTATNVSVQELAETQYSAISAGVKATESIEASVTATKLAKAGFTDANSALKIMTSTMNVFGLEGTEAMQQISDKLLVTQNLGVTTVAELSQSLGPLTPIAKSAGVSIDELFSGMAALTKNGLETNEAVTAYKGVLTSVIKPTSEASKMAKQLGIDFSTSAIESKGMAGFLQEIKEKTGGNTEVMGKLFGNVRALSGALILTGDGIDDFNSTLDAMKNSAGATDEAFEIMTNTIGFKLSKMKNTTKNIFTSIMMSQSGAIGEYIDKIDGWVTNNEERIQGWVKNIGDGITKVIEFIKGILNFIKEHEKLISTILVFIMSLYTVIKVMGILKTVLTGLHTIWLIFNGTLVVSPIGWIILAIGALIAIGYALWRNWDTVSEKAGQLWESIKAAFSPIGDFFKGIWEGVKVGFKSFINFFIDGINKVISGINSVKVKVPDWVPKFGGQEFGINIAQLPKFAKGGIATGPSIFGEAGPEIAIPLKKTKRSQDLLTQANMLINKNKGSATTNQLTNNYNTSSKKDVSINVYFQGVTVGEEEFFEKAGQHIANKIKLVIGNTV